MAKEPPRPADDLPFTLLLPAVGLNCEEIPYSIANDADIPTAGPVEQLHQLLYRTAPPA